MRASKNSKRSRRSSTTLTRAAVALGLVLVAAAAVYFVQAKNHALYYGDAAAHLNIARRLIDGRTLGYHQIGTVWLPLPHLLFMPFVGSDEWWHNGLAGAIPSAAAWVLAGVFLFLLLQRLFSNAAALAGLGVFALNPNLLYLAATPMTETIFFAAALGMLYTSAEAVARPSVAHAFLCGVCALAATMTRYEGWFLLPFALAYLLFAGGAKRWHLAIVFSSLAAAGPLYWIAHNWIFYSDPLEFFRGPDSAKAIYQRYLDKGMARYPGDHNWPQAIRQFAIATKAVNGWTLLGIAAAGLVPALRSKAFWPLLFFSLSPAFYVMSLHSGGTPIFIPEIYPFSHYNTRYALAALPLFALCAAGLAHAVPRLAWFVVPAAASWFFFQPVLTWRESEVNSDSRRAWTAEVASILQREYRPGSGILMPFGDLTAILTEAKIPIRESLHQGDELAYERSVARPDLFLQEEWAVVIAGEPAGDAMARVSARGLPYRLLKRISLKNAPVVEVWRRTAPPRE
jgi:hypothetical protein